MSLISYIEAGCKNLKLDVDVQALDRYLDLLEQWNRAYNLTAIHSPIDRVYRHILDSLAIFPWLQGTNCIDVGTGPGLPGIPLAIADSTRQWVLLDSNGKKTRFLMEVKRVLGLKNIEIMHARAEDYRSEKLFDCVVSRAFTDLNSMITWTKQLLAPQGIWLAMKGKVPHEELASLIHPYEVHQYQVPNLDAERSCIVISNK